MDNKVKNWKQLVLTTCTMGGICLLMAGCQPRTQILQPRGSLPPTFDATPITIENQPGVQTPQQGPVGGESVIGDDLPVVDNTGKIAEQPGGMDIAEQENTAKKPNSGREVADLPKPPVTPPAEQTFFYTVQNGDVLSRIAVAYGTTSKKIMEINGLSNPNKIVVGQKLKVPGDGTVVKQVKKGGSTKAGNKSGAKTGSKTGTKTSSNKSLKEIPADGFHTVAAGDSLSKIASQYKGVTTPGLCEANGITRETRLHIGQKIKLVASATIPEPKQDPEQPVVTQDPITSSQGGVEGPVADSGNATVEEYAITVGVDDNIDMICNLFDCTVEEFQRLNPDVKTDADLKNKKSVVVPKTNR